MYFRVDVILMLKRIGSSATEGRARAPQMENGAKRGHGKKKGEGLKSHFNFRADINLRIFLRKD